jgi:homoserine O-succinyltransferase
MPIIVDDPSLLADITLTARLRRTISPSTDLSDRKTDLTIGFVNNMPDSALASTEQQFLTLIHEAASHLLVRVKLFSIDGIPRNERAREHITKHYADVRDLLSGRLDGLIVTGTEPRRTDLADEPYWASLTELIAWAQRNTTTTIFSCLAAHAAVLHLDGISRTPLPEKRFGVFEHQKRLDHFLLEGSPGSIATPHSRWNELPGKALASSGYNILTESSKAGVDMFIKRGKSLFVFFQGHPEYEAETLWREYRRDVGRYLRGEQARYPGLPNDYFDATTMQALQAFRLRAEADRREPLLSEFPVALMPAGIAATWRSQAACTYRNWFKYMAAKRERTDNKRVAATWPASAAP